jgi:hypothetical protein
MPPDQNTHLLDWPTYPLPSFLEGRCDQTVFVKWLDVKADSLLSRDKKRGKPYALNTTQAAYKREIYKAVLNSGEYDPYTGDPLAWELIGEWDTGTDQPDGYKKRFRLMPTVDHITPDALEFEICAWQVNDAKAGLNPGEFVELCKKVVKRRDRFPD